VIKFLIKY